MKEDVVSFLNAIWIFVSDTQDLSTGLMENVSCVAMWQNDGKCWPLNGVIERRMEWEKEEEESHALISNGNFMERHGCWI